MALLLSFDLETTGLSVWNDRITQIGGTAVRKRKQEADKDKGADEGADQGAYTLVANFETLVKSEVSVSAEAAKKTGISNKDLVNAPPIAEALTLFFNWIREIREQTEVILIAYNGINFDFPILCNEITRCQQLPYVTLNACGITTVLDPYVWACANLEKSCVPRKTNGKYSYKLSDLHMALLERPLVNAHTALADTQGLIDLCFHEKFTDVVTFSIPGTNYSLSLSKYIHMFREKQKARTSSQTKSAKHNVPSISEAFSRCRKRKSPDETPQDSPQDSPHEDEKKKPKIETHKIE